MKLSLAKRFIALCLALCFDKSSLGAEPFPKMDRYWLPLTQDELHDPKTPGLDLLQDPSKALSLLPRDATGDQVNWVKALESNIIHPSLNFRSKIQAEVLNMDILFPDTGEMDMVVFPHKQHTEWLVCSNCHEEIFKYKAHATKFGMLEILNGEYCGRCHGSVAFPLTECTRCHNLPRASIAGPAKPN